MNKLAYEINGKVEYLPMWYSLKSDEEIEAAKQIVIESAKNPKPQSDQEPIIIDEVKIKKMLKSDGFTKNQIEEIIAKFYCGYTLDSAMQSVF